MKLICNTGREEKVSVVAKSICAGSQYIEASGFRLIGWPPLSSVNQQCSQYRQERILENPVIRSRTALYHRFADLSPVSAGWICELANDMEYASVTYLRTPSRDSYSRLHNIFLRGQCAPFIV